MFGKRNYIAVAILWIMMIGCCTRRELVVKQVPIQHIPLISLSDSLKKWFPNEFYQFHPELPDTTNLVRCPKCSNWMQDYGRVDDLIIDTYPPMWHEWFYCSKCNIKTIGHQSSKVSIGLHEEPPGELWKEER